MTPKKLPSGKWRAQGYFKDPATGEVLRPSFTASTKAEAARMVSDFQARHKLRISKDMLVKDCIGRYVTVKESTLSPSTIRGYRAMQRNNYASIENLRLSALTNEIMQGFISRLCQTKEPKYVRNVYALLTASINMFSDNLIFKVSLPQKKVMDYHIPTEEDVRQLIQAASPSLRIAIVLAAMGTLRAGEVCALKYRDVDTENGGIRVHSDMVKTPDNEWIVKEVPKTSASVRFVPLPDEAMKLIGTGAPDDFVYGKSPAAVTCAFERLRKRFGLECRFHDLRHFAASSMHAQNIPDIFIQERGGWKTSTTLRAVYTHALSDQSKKYADIANKCFSRLL